MTTPTGKAAVLAQTEPKQYQPPPPMPRPAPPAPPVGKAAVLAQTEPKQRAYPLLEPPVPVLQQHGFDGGIQQFNYRVQQAVDKYQKSYGSMPSPGLVFDIARSPFDTEQFDKLFSVPSNAASAKAQATINTVDASDTLVVRHDGYVEHNNPGRQLIYQSPATVQKRYQSLQKTHPWVQAGMFPIDQTLVAGLWNALAFANSHPEATKPLTEGGTSLQQYQQENKLGESITSLHPLESLGQMASDQGAAAKQLRQEGMALADREQVARGVTTVQKAQDALKSVAPQFFSDLPSTGFVNSDWQKAIGKYVTSAQYFRQQTTKMSHDHNFGDNTGAFIHAWEAQQSAIKKNPALAPFLRHQPLAFFDWRTHGGAVKNLLAGNTKGWGWANVPTVFLGGLVHTAGVALDEVAGTLDEAKTTGAFVTAYMQAIAPKGVPVIPAGLPIFIGVGKGETEKQARERATKTLYEHPTWARVFVPDYNENNKTEQIIGEIANTAVDLAIGSGKFTGGFVRAGDMSALEASRYANVKALWSFNALKDGKLGESVATLEHGSGAERLNATLEDAVKSGEVDFPTYRKHVFELYAHGTTDVGGTEVTGPLLRSLRSKDMPTSGRVGLTAQKVHKAVNAKLNDWENSLRVNKQIGATNHASDFIASVRQLTARAAPAGEKRYIFDTRTPEDVYNWARVNLKDEKIASDLRDQFIRLRATNDVQGVTALSDKMRSLYKERFPESDIASNPLESQGPEIESESRSYLFFPKTLETNAQKITAKLNAIGRAHRQTIVGGSPVPFAPVPGFGESLAYKHAIADTARRVIGGGGFFGITGELKTVKASVDAWARENPDTLRLIGVNREAARMGENRWVTGKRAEDIHNFSTGDAESVVINGKSVKPEAAYEAAGGYLRRHVSSKALKAYQQSTPEDVSPLMDLISHDTTFQSLLFKDVRTFSPSTDWQALPDGVQIPTGGELRSRNNVTQVRYPGPVPAPIRFGGVTTTEAAQALYNRYREIEDAGIKAGVTDPLNDALDVLVKHLGHGQDKKLGEWIRDNGLNFAVRDGVVNKSQWDDVMGKWIGVLMTANKWNRGTLFDHVFYSTTNELTKAGWGMNEAVPVAADLAKAQTVYHMLDFANMLQVEQNLRWLSYFATKHRLYWTWILRQAVARPGLGAAVQDAKNHLDTNGNLNLTVFGHRIYVPAARLFWVNAREYPQTSPLVQTAAETGKGLAEGHGPAALGDAFSSLTSTSGNVLTRDDQAEMLAIKLAGVSSGLLPANADSVTFGMTAAQKRQFSAAVNSYASFFRAQHGDWPNESDAVKHVLLHETVRQFQSSNLFLPVLWDGDGNPSPRVKKLSDQYGRIVDPAKKRAFLDQHPEVALRFGVADDPAVYLHNNRLWDKYNVAYKQVEAQRALILQDILAHGFTAQISKRMSALSDAWTKTVDGFKLEDANWPGNAQFPKGKISDGQIVQPGPWGLALEGDPFLSRAFIHNSFDGIAKPELNAHTVGEQVLNFQKQLDLYKRAMRDAKPGEVAEPDLQHVRDHISQINQVLAPFYAYPKNAPSKLQSEYYNKFVGPYIKERDARSAKLTLLPSDQQDAMRSEFRAWKDEHDHPVFITYQGQKIKFPSVVRIGWARLPEDQRHLGLAQAAAGDWAHVASYEKTLLGVKTDPAVSQGWAAYADALRQYGQSPKNPRIVFAQRKGLAKEINQAYPGFYKDWLFAQQPKVDRFMATQIYRAMPQRSDFNEVIATPARQIAAAIKANGHKDYYMKSWRLYVETKVTPWLDTQPQLKKEMADYGPDFLSTLPN